MRLIENHANLRSIVTRRSMLPPPDRRDDPHWKESWAYLCRVYRPAMVRYVQSVLTRAEGQVVSRDDAADVVQDYLAQAIEKGWLGRDAHEIRCFRAYLQVQLSRFAISHVRHRHARKRSPEGRASPDVLDHVAGGGAEGADAELDAGWVEAITEHVLAKLRISNETYHAVIVDLLYTHGDGSRDLAEQLGCPASRLKGLKHRARRRLALLFFQELRLSVRDEEAYEALFTRLADYLP